MAANLADAWTIHGIKVNQNASKAKYQKLLNGTQDGCQVVSDEEEQKNPLASGVGARSQKKRIEANVTAKAGRARNVRELELLRRKQAQAKVAGSSAAVQRKRKGGDGPARPNSAAKHGHVVGEGAVASVKAEGKDKDCVIESHADVGYTLDEPDQWGVLPLDISGVLWGLKVAGNRVHGASALDP